MVVSLELNSLQQSFDKSLTNQSKFYRNYMSLFETLLLFIRASREQSWGLHLYSLHSLCPYFFAFNMTNYARMTPVYLSQMFELKDKDQQTWEMMANGCFSVNKSEDPFTAIGADHCLEQENRSLKVLGGIKGIANSSQAVSEYFLSAAEMGSIVGNFCETFGIEENQSRKRDEHHQLFGSKNKRIYSNTEKILRVFQTHNVNFEASDSVFNILTRKVLPSKEAECFLNAKEIGKARYEQFVEEKFDGDGSIWDTIKREKLLLSAITKHRK